MADPTDLQYYSIHVRFKAGYSEGTKDEWSDPFVEDSFLWDTEEAAIAWTRRAHEALNTNPNIMFEVVPVDAQLNTWGRPNDED